jgi:prepilin-type processing-associated H-X9-DG protein
MGIALKLYVDDMRGRYPMFGYYTNELLVSYIEWPEALRSYYPIAWTNRDFHCPGYNGVVMTSGSAATANGGTASWGGYAGSYGYNGPGSWNSLFKLQHPPHLGLGEGYLDYDASNPRAVKYPPPISESQLNAPSEMLAFGDSRAGRGPDVFPPHKVVWGGDSSLDCGNLGLFPDFLLCPARHGRNYNFAFCDARVAGINPFVMFNPTNSAVLWNIDHQPHPETW